MDTILVLLFFFAVALAAAAVIGAITGAASFVWGCLRQSNRR